MSTTLLLKSSDNPSTTLPFYNMGLDPSTLEHVDNVSFPHTAWGWNRLVNTQGSLVHIATNQSVAGPTTGIDAGDVHWVTDPLAADVTISGSISVNVWCKESSGVANAAVNFLVYKIDGATGAMTTIVTSARTTEMGTASAAAAFSATPGAGVDCKRGDRLAINFFFDDTNTMAFGFDLEISYNGGVGVDGDSFVTFTENLTFEDISATPAGSVIYLTDAAVSGVATASVDREAWTARGSGVVDDVVNTAAGFTAPIQLTDTAGGTVVDWFTKPLLAFTLGGLAKANIRAKVTGGFATRTAVMLEIAVVDLDGSNPVVWGIAHAAYIPSTAQYDLDSTEAAAIIWVAGDDVSVTEGQRLRFRLYIDDATPSGSMVTGQTATVYYSGTSGGASGDSFITLPQTLTELELGYPQLAPGRRLSWLS